MWCVRATIFTVERQLILHNLYVHL